MANRSTTVHWTAKALELALDAQAAVSRAIRYTRRSGGEISPLIRLQQDLGEIVRSLLALQPVETMTLPGFDEGKAGLGEGRGSAAA